MAPPLVRTGPRQANEKDDAVAFERPANGQQAEQRSAFEPMICWMVECLRSVKGAAENGWRSFRFASCGPPTRLYRQAIVDFHQPSMSRAPSREPEPVSHLKVAGRKNNTHTRLAMAYSGTCLGSG